MKTNTWMTVVALLFVWAWLYLACDGTDDRPTDSGVADADPSLDADDAQDALLDNAQPDGTQPDTAQDTRPDVSFPPLEIEVDLTPNSGTVPLHLDASATVTGGSGRYWIAWDFEPEDSIAPNALGENASYTYGLAGTYAASVMVFDELGESATESFVVTVSERTYEPCDHIEVIGQDYPDESPRIIENCEFQGDGAFQVLIQNSSNVTIRHSRFRDFHAVQLIECDPPDPYRCTSDAAVTVEASSRVRIEESVFERVEGGVIVSWNSSDIDIVGNSFSDVNATEYITSAGAIWINDPRNVTVTNNLIRRVGHLWDAEAICTGHREQLPGVFMDDLTFGIYVNGIPGSHNVLLEANHIMDVAAAHISSPADPSVGEEPMTDIRIIRNSLHNAGPLEPFVSLTAFEGGQVSQNLMVSDSYWGTACRGSGFVLMGTRDVVFDNNFVIGVHGFGVVANSPELVFANNTFVGEPDRDDDCGFLECNPTGLKMVHGGIELRDVFRARGYSDEAWFVNNIFYDINDSVQFVNDRPVIFDGNVVYIPADRMEAISGNNGRAAGARAVYPLSEATVSFWGAGNMQLDPQFSNIEAYLPGYWSPIRNAGFGGATPGLQQTRDLSYIEDLTARPVSIGENLLNNGSAESGADEWTVGEEGPAVAVAAVETAEISGTAVLPSSGDRFFHVSGSAAGPVSIRHDIIVLDLPPAVNDAGAAVFELQANIVTGEAVAGAGFEFVLAFFDDRSEPRGQISSTSIYEGAHYSPGEYTHYVYSGLIPPGVTQAWVELVARPAPDNNIDVAFDDVTFSVSY